MIGFVQTQGGGGSTLSDHRATCFFGEQNIQYDIENTIEKQGDNLKVA